MPAHPGGGFRRDLGGGIDLVWFGASLGIVGIQACAASGLAAHRTKLLAEPRMREWIAAGGRLCIHSWGTLAVVKKDGKKGKARRWTLREVELRLEDFAATEPASDLSAALPAGS